MRYFRILALILSAAVLFCACGTEIAPPLVSSTVVTDAPPVREPYPISVGNETFEEAPVSVASLSPALTEMLYDIGVGDRLLGVSDYCDYPSDTENLAKIGSPAKPDIEAAIALAPELLITQSPLAETDILRLKNAGIRVLNFEEPTGFAGLCEIYIQLSMIFYGSTDSQAVASGVLEPMDSAMSEAEQRGIDVSFVIVEAAADGGLMLSHRDTLSSDMLSVFGENIWGGEDYYASAEDMVDLAPDVIFFADGVDRDDIREHFPRAELIKIDFERFERPTVRLGELIKECAEELTE